MIDVTSEHGSAGEIFERLKTDWTELFWNSGASPFLSRAWLSTWCKSFAADRIPIILTVRRNGDLIGILALVRDQSSLLGFRVERAEMMGSGFGAADYLDIIAKPEDRVDCLNAFMHFLSGQTEALDIIEFADMGKDSQTYALLKQKQAKTGFRLTELQREVCPNIDLTPGWQAVLNQSKRKANFRRRLKELERQPGFRFVTVTDPREVDAAFDRFLDLHSKRWQAAGGSELSGHPSLVSFHRAAAAALAEEGLVRFDEVWLGDRCCASVYGFDNGEAFYYYNSGYDADLKHLSLGLVLLGLSIKAAAERGNSNYDLLRGSESYKFDWATGHRELVTLTLSKPRPLIGALARVNDMQARLRSAAKWALPSRIAEPLGNWHRQLRRKQQLSN